MDTNIAIAFATFCACHLAAFIYCRWLANRSRRRSRQQTTNIPPVLFVVSYTMIGDAATETRRSTFWVNSKSEAEMIADCAEKNGSLGSPSIFLARPMPSLN